MHTHRATEIPINKALPHFGDVVVMHQAEIEVPIVEQCVKEDALDSPTREQVVRRITRDLHTHVQVPLHRRCLPECGPTSCHTRDIETTFVYRLLPRLSGAFAPHVDLPPSRVPSGGSSVSFSKIDTSVRSTLGTQTLLSTGRLLEDAEMLNCTKAS